MVGSTASVTRGVPWRRCVTGAVLTACAIGCAATVAPDAGDATRLRTCPSPVADAGAAPASASIASLRGAPVLGLARTTRVDEECSGAGGAHVTLEWVFVRCGVAGEIVRIAFGGHAYYPMPRPMPGTLMAVGVAPDAHFATPGSRDAPGWCLMNLPTVQGEVIGWWPVRDEAEGRALLEMIAP